GVHGPEDRHLDEHAGHEVVDVVLPGGERHLPHTGEDVAEQQHEHQRLDRGEHQEPGHTAQGDEVAAGDAQRVPAGGEAARRDGPGGDGGHPAAPAMTAGAPPVRWRNTSSRLGSRTARPLTATPAPSRAWRAAISSWGPSPDRSRSVAPSRSTQGPTVAASTASQRWASASSTVSSMTVVPSRAFSAAAVSSTMTRPWSITAIRSVRRSASSRYCVVSSTV